MTHVSASGYKHSQSASIVKDTYDDISIYKGKSTAVYIFFKCQHQALDMTTACPQSDHTKVL